MKHTKNIILCFFLITSTLVLGQEDKEGFDKIKALKTAYFTEKLDLSSNEAQKFWPVYNLHSGKLHELRDQLRRNIREKLKKVNGVDNLSEAEAKQIVDFGTATEKEIHQEELLMIKELSEIISQKKIVKLKIAEYEFKKKLIGKLRGMRKNNK